MEHSHEDNELLQPMLGLDLFIFWLEGLAVFFLSDEDTAGVLTAGSPLEDLHERVLDELSLVGLDGVDETGDV